MIPSYVIAEIVAESLKPLPPEKPPHIVGMCKHECWNPIKMYCLNCHVTRETLVFRPELSEAWKGN